MYTAANIRDLEIKRTTFGGYNLDEVDDLLDAIADQLEKGDSEKDELRETIAKLNGRLEEYRESEGSIHTTLLNAQRMADQTIKEASETAGHTSAEAAKKAEITVNNAELEAQQILSDARLEADRIIKDAIAKTESMISAAHDSVARQQLLFDKVKVETRNFKAGLMEAYKAQVELISGLPDEVPFDAVHAAEAISFAFDQAPDYQAMVSGRAAADEAAEAPAEAPVPVSVPEAAETPAVPAEPEADFSIDGILSQAEAAEAEPASGFQIRFDDAE